MNRKVRAPQVILCAANGLRATRDNRFLADALKMYSRRLTAFVDRLKAAEIEMVDRRAACNSSRRRSSYSDPNHAGGPAKEEKSFLTRYWPVWHPLGNIRHSRGSAPTTLGFSRPRQGRKAN